jgi:hypothetical protein
MTIYDNIHYHANYDRVSIYEWVWYRECKLNYWDQSFLHISPVLIFQIFLTLYKYMQVVTATRMKLALYLCQSSNNTLLNELVSKAATHWDIEQKKRKALVKVWDCWIMFKAGSLKIEVWIMKFEVSLG